MKMMVFYGNQIIKVRQIVYEALTEAVSSASSRSYREIWVDMLGSVMELQAVGSLARWKKAESEFQDKFAELIGFPFSEFIGHMSKIENSVLKVLAQEQQEPILN